MRLLIVSALIAVLVTRPAHAEVVVPTQPLVESPDEGRGEHITGMIITGVGVAAAAFAIFSFAVAANVSDSSDAKIAFTAYGVLGSLAAGVHLAVGIPLWVDGNRRIDAARARAGQVSLAPAPAGSFGAGVRWTF